MMTRLLLNLHNVSCGFGGQAVVQDLDLHLNAGDIACLLGPSGCGKTTSLRAIAGFEPLLAGEISLAGEVISRPGFTLPPEQRRIGMVFQDYALFPHLSVAQNVAFGIRQHPQSRRITAELLELVNLSELGKRYPHELSGGQQQRVALARALAPEPRMLLLDEPFSNLDGELRRRLSKEVRDILKARGTSAILVTHDQEEAFAVSDHVGVFQNGRLQQWDTPYNLYHEPLTPFVASFIGQGYFIRGQLMTPDTVQTWKALRQCALTVPTTCRQAARWMCCCAPMTSCPIRPARCRQGSAARPSSVQRPSTACNCRPAASWKRSSPATPITTPANWSASASPPTIWCCFRPPAASPPAGSSRRTSPLRRKKSAAPAPAQRSHVRKAPHQVTKYS